VSHPQRRVELDWLRVIAFLLLILFHTGMFFVPWDFHLKNDVTSRWFELWMVPLNQFRLPLLFMISGMGACFAASHRSVRGFLKERTVRLLVPLIFGMFVIIPPQIYFERQYKGAHFSTYFEFYKTVLEFVPYPKGNFSWHHLWYIIYIYVYSLICIPLLLFFKGRRSEQFKAKASAFFLKPGRLYLLGAPLLLSFYALAPFFPVTHDLINDWYNFSHSLLLFVIGIAILSVDGFWNALEKQRKAMLIAAMLPFTFLWLFVWGPTFEIMDEDTWSFFIIYGFLKTSFLICLLMAIFGYSKYIFRKSSKFLVYATEAVYPFYILHQTVMVVFGFYVIRWRLGILPKYLLVAAVTFGGTFVIYELCIRRFNSVRVLFGMKRV
jgi:glucan biosynthesis protein C